MLYSNSEIGENIKRHRKAKKLRQRELAGKIGKSESSVQKYEKGLVNIPLEALFEIAKVLNVPIYDLCGFGDEPSKPKTTVGEIVETLIGIRSKYRLIDKEDDALCEVCNILDMLPRNESVEKIKDKLERDDDMKGPQATLKGDKLTVTELGYPTHTFKIVDSVPPRYFIWCIGKHMPKGYLPLCKLKAEQEFPGGRSIETWSLKAIRINDSDKILEAAHCGGNIPEMEEYIERHKDADPGSYEHTRIERIKEALPIMRQIKWE